MTDLLSEPTETNALERLRAAKGFVFDMDGVLYRGDHQLPGVIDLINALVIRGIPHMLATNNSMATPEMYVTKLGKMGIDSDPKHILTSATATRLYLDQHLHEEARVYVVGMPPLRDQLFNDSKKSFADDDGDVDAVVVGLDIEFTYAKLKKANAAIRSGAAFIATNTDATLPTEEGLVPGAGSIIAAIQMASGVNPVIIGKPEPTTLHMSARTMELDPTDCVMIGDRIDTDILAGARAGMLTALVLTGVSTREDIAKSDVLPDLVFSDLTALLSSFTGEE